MDDGDAPGLARSQSGGAVRPNAGSRCRPLATSSPTRRSRRQLARPGCSMCSTGGGAKPMSWSCRGDAGATTSVHALPSFALAVHARRVIQSDDDRRQLVWMVNLLPPSARRSVPRWNVSVRWATNVPVGPVARTSWCVPVGQPLRRPQSASSASTSPSPRRCPLGRREHSRTVCVAFGAPMRNGVDSRLSTVR